MRAALALSIALLALCGCASQAFSIRTLPAETPAADDAAAVIRAAALAAAVHVAAERTSSEQAASGVIPLTAADAPSMHTYDPLERLNRSTYRFNARFDEAIFLPVADAYRRLPSPMRAGVHNFFGNLSEPKKCHQLRAAAASGIRPAQPWPIRDQQHPRHRRPVGCRHADQAERAPDWLRRDTVHLGHAPRPLPGHSAPRSVDVA